METLGHSQIALTKNTYHVHAGGFNAKRLTEWRPFAGFQADLTRG
jgi:hypothetical protein